MTRNVQCATLFTWIVIEYLSCYIILSPRDVHLAEEGPLAGHRPPGRHVAAPLSAHTQRRRSTSMPRPRTLQSLPPRQRPPCGQQSTAARRRCVSHRFQPNCTRADSSFRVFIIAAPEDGKQPDILYIIPIIPGFKHNLEQTPPSPSTSFFHQSAKPRKYAMLFC